MNKKPADMDLDRILESVYDQLVGRSWMCRLQDKLKTSGTSHQSENRKITAAFCIWINALYRAKWAK